MVNLNITYDTESGKVAFPGWSSKDLIRHSGKMLRAVTLEISGPKPPAVTSLLSSEKMKVNVADGAIWVSTVNKDEARARKYTLEQVETAYNNMRAGNVLKAEENGLKFYSTGDGGKTTNFVLEALIKSGIVGTPQ